MVLKSSFFEEERARQGLQQGSLQWGHLGSFSCLTTGVRRDLGQITCALTLLV